MDRLMRKGEKGQEASTLHKELQATKECQEAGEMVFLEKNTPAAHPIERPNLLHLGTCFHRKRKTKRGLRTWPIAGP